MKESNKNKGMSLIEIVVALAVLSLLMIAVISLISNNSIIFRRNKKDMQMQVQAEEAFNIICDDLKSAKYIYIKDVDGNTYTLSGAGASNPFTSSEIEIEEMIIVYSASLDTGMLSGVTYDLSGDVKYIMFNGTGSGAVVGGVDDVNSAIVKDTDGVPTLNRSPSSNHKIYYGEADLCLADFKFTKNSSPNPKHNNELGYVTLTKQYLYMSDLDITTTSDLDQIKICEALDYAKIKVNASNNSIDINMRFNDSGREFTVNNLVNIKNDGIIRETN